MTARKKTGAPRKELPPEKMVELEKAFRAGLMSWRAMSDEFGVGMSWLKATSERLGWTRDQAARIQQEAQRRDQETIAREIAVDEKKKNPDYKLTEKEVTASNVELIARVTSSHRALLARSRALAEKLFAELEGATDGQDLLEQLAECLAASDEAKRAAVVNKITGIGNRSTVFKQLAETIKIIISTEREVLRIADATTGQESSVGALISRVMGTGFKPVREHESAD